MSASAASGANRPSSPSWFDLSAALQEISTCRRALRCGGDRAAPFPQPGMVGREWATVKGVTTSVVDAWLPRTCATARPQLVKADTAPRRIRWSADRTLLNFSKSRLQEREMVCALIKIAEGRAQTCSDHGCHAGRRVRQSPTAIANRNMHKVRHQRPE